MYARIGQGQVQPGDDMEQGARNFKEIVVPVLKKQKGFKHIYIMADRQAGKVYSIGLWESEADMRAFVGSETQLKMVAEMRAAGAPQMEWVQGEVMVEA